MARRMIAQRDMDRFQIELQFALGVHSPQIGAGFAAVGGQRAGHRRRRPVADIRASGIERRPARWPRYDIPAAPLRQEWRRYVRPSNRA